MADDDSEKTMTPKTDTTATLTNRRSSFAEGVEDVAKRTYHKLESLVLYALHEAPEYQRDNHFILSGYRGQLDSFKTCFHSIWYVHNETGNLPCLQS